MTEYTRENPFEFEGARYARSEHGGVVTFDGYGNWVQARKPEAIHAFIEAERNTWHWTNDNHTEARNGRWVVTVPTGECVGRVHHDDLPVEDWCTDLDEGNTVPAAGYRVPVTAIAVSDDFLTWRAEQDAPEEPEGFGYVGTLVDPGGDEWDVTRNRLGSYPWSVVNRRTGDYALHATWADARGTNEFEQAVRS